MGKDDVQGIKEIMKKFDPALVAIAVREIGVKDEVIVEEVDKIKAELSIFDPKAVAKAAADYVGASSVTFHCGGPVCTCPEDGCGGYFIKCGTYGLRADIDRSVREIEYLGLSQAAAVQDLDKNRGASAVIGAGGKLGYAALCWDTVTCTGKSIYVMNACMASLYAFDIGSNVIDPADAILAIAKSSPSLFKRATMMIEDMKAKGELPS